MYKVLAPVYDAALADAFQPVIRDRLDSALAEHGATDPGRLLDLGCGTGTLAVEMAERGWEVTGVDLSPQMLEIARDRAGGRDAVVEWVREDMRRFRREGAFQLAVSFYDSLNHLMTNADLMRVLANVRASLAPGGLLAFDVNNRLAYWTLWEDPEPFEAEVNGARIRIGTTFDRSSRVGEALVEVWRDGTVERETVRQRFFSDSEIQGLLMAEGFQVLEARDFAVFEGEEGGTPAGGGESSDAVWRDHPDPEKVKTFWLVRKATR